MVEQNNGEIQQLKKIQKELATIRDNTGNSGWFLRGILQGAGVILGSALTVLAVSWLLSVIGVVPGFADIAKYLGDVFSNLRH